MSHGVARGPGLALFLVVPDVHFSFFPGGPSAVVVALVFARVMLLMPADEVLVHLLQLLFLRVSVLAFYWEVFGVGFVFNNLFSSYSILYNSIIASATVVV